MFPKKLNICLYIYCWISFSYPVYKSKDTENVYKSGIHQVQVQVKFGVLALKRLTFSNAGSRVPSNVITTSQTVASFPPNREQSTPI